MNGRVVVRNYLTIPQYIVYSRMRNVFGTKLMRLMLISLILCLNDEKCREWLRSI